MSTPQDSKPTKPIKAKGPFRTEAAIPILIVIALTWGYFHFFFDRNLKSIMQTVGYHVLGAQVDIQNLETSFWRASFRLQGLEITNAQNPSRNMAVIGDIRFGVSWDGLLRAKLIINEMAVEQIQIDTARKSPGRVKPPEPPKPEDNKPSALEKEAAKLKEKALAKAKSEYSENAIGDLAAMLSGSSGSDQLGKIEESLASKAKLAELQKAYDEKSKVWQQKLAELPKPAEIQSIGDRINKIKASNFKNPQELVESLNQLKVVAEDADKKYKQISQTSSDLTSDLKMFEQGLKEVDALVKKDIADLEKRFKIPKLDAKALAESLFRPYLQPYLSRFHQYKAMADKYLPPNLMKKGKPDEVDIQMQPRPRAKGVTYEFGRAKSYPIFWIKKISISSKASPTLGTGNLSGLITDVTSNQALIGRPTTAKLGGDFPSMQINGFAFEAIFNNLKAESLISYDLKVANYPLATRPLVDSSDVKIILQKADAELQSKGQLVGLKNFSMTLNNNLKKVDYEIKAQNETVDGILKNVFASLPVLTLDTKGEGELPDLDLSINSNLGPELQRGFETEVKKKIDEAKGKIQKMVDDQIGKEKSKLEGDVNKTKSQVDGEVKKVQAQLDAKKKDVDSKMNSAKKDEENKAKKQLENEGAKAVDELKKKFGL